MTTTEFEEPERPHPLVAALSGFWESTREFYRLLMPIRFSFLTLLVLAIALLVTDQGSDALAALAEGNPTWRKTSVIAVQVLFAVLVALFAAQIWYWSRQLLRVEFRGQPDPAEWPRAVAWIPRLLGLAVFAIAIVSLGRVRAMYDGEIRKPATVLLGIMIALGIEAALFVVFVIFRRKKIGGLTTVRRLRDFGPVTLRVLRLTTLLAVIAFVGSTFATQNIARIGTISILMMSLALWVALGGVIVYGGMKARIPILTWLLLFAIAISPLADNHAVRTISGTLPKRPTADVAFNNWYARLVANTPTAAVPRPVFIVATEGGGIRAAYWTAAVLTSLSDTVPGFTDHLFAVSGVSGGSVGATTYRALLAEPSAAGKLRSFAREALAYDALAPTIVAFTQQDFIQRFVFVPILPDRAKALEVGWEYGWRDALPHNARFSNGFLATTNTEAANRLPALFLNGTTVEGGQRTITSNVLIDGRFAGASDTFALIGADVPMSTGAHNGARFPYVSPVGSTATRHIADGGYFENSGAGTAANLLDVVRSHPDFKAGKIRPYLIFIDCKGSDRVSLSRFANELIAPFRTLFGTRTAHATAAVAEVHQRMKREDMTTFSLVQHKGERFPLGWLLAARTRDVMDKQMGRDSAENGANVKAIASALGVQAKPDAVWQLATGQEQQARTEEQQ